MEFQNVGTKRIGIGQCAKVGTMSLLGISELSHQQQPSNGSLNCISN